MFSLHSFCVVFLCSLDSEAPELTHTALTIAEALLEMIRSLQSTSIFYGAPAHGWSWFC